MAGKRSLTDIWKPALVVVIGLVLVGYGLSIDPNAPACGSTPMEPGQICETTSKGVPRKQSYEDMVAEGQQKRLGFPIGGGVVALAGIAWGVLMVVRRRGAGAAKGTPGAAVAAPPTPAPPAPAPSTSSGQWVRQPREPQPGPQYPHGRSSAPWPQQQPYPQQAPPPPPQQPYPPQAYPPQQTYPPQQPCPAPWPNQPPQAYPPQQPFPNDPFSGPTPPRH